MIMGDELASQSEARSKVQLTNSIAANLQYCTKCWEAQKKCVQIYKNSFPQVDRQNFPRKFYRRNRKLYYTNDMI